MGFNGGALKKKIRVGIKYWKISENILILDKCDFVKAAAAKV